MFRRHHVVGLSFSLAVPPPFNAFSIYLQACSKNITRSTFSFQWGRLVSSSFSSGTLCSPVDGNDSEPPVKGSAEDRKMQPRSIGRTQPTTQFSNLNFL